MPGTINTGTRLIEEGALLPESLERVLQLDSDPLERVEVLHLARNAAVESRGVEACDCGNAALPGQKVLPAFVRPDSYGADESDACHNYPASQLCLLLDEVVLGIATGKPQTPKCES
jgi:hypothetical protein